MNVDVTMPQLGETVSEGTVTRWLRNVGDVIADQEPLLEISTDKVDTEVPSPGAGTLLEILVGEDVTVPVGALLARLGPAGPTTATPERIAAPADAPIGGPTVAEPVPAAAHAVSAADHRHQHTPRVRHRAAEAGIELSTVRGTGPAGRVTTADVDQAAAAAVTKAAATPPVTTPPAPPAPTTFPPVTTVAADERRQPMSRLRSVIAERMVTSLQTSAQLTSVVEVDVTPVVALRARVVADLRDRLGVRLTLTAFFAKAVVEALRDHPVLNASIEADGRTVVQHARQHLGIAVDTESGLMVPVVKDAGDLNLLGLSRRIGELAERTRSGSVSADDLAGGTFTLTNTGSRGALWDTPILVPGQVGILGTGTVVERPVVVRGSDGGQVIAIRSMAYLALTYDHRLVDGADAARFLTTIKNRLEAGQFDSDLG